MPQLFVHTHSGVSSRIRVRVTILRVLINKRAFTSGRCDTPPPRSRSRSPRIHTTTFFLFVVVVVVVVVVDKSENKGTHAALRVDILPRVGNARNARERSGTRQLAKAAKRGCS